MLLNISTNLKSHPRQRAFALRPIRYSFEPEILRDYRR
eukprot:COSAG03_NODE_21417_length_304_cov_1.000000_1_plen_37_part_10